MIELKLLRLVLRTLVSLVLFSAPLQAQSLDTPITQADWDNELSINQKKNIEFKGGLNYHLGQEHIDAYQLAISAKNLGGFSTIEFIHKPGEVPKFIAFSDNHGLWMTVELMMKQGRLDSIQIDRMGILIDPKTGKGLNDIESMSIDGTNMVLAFEGKGKLWRLDSLEAKPAISNSIPGVKSFPQNGIESMTRLADGRLFAIAELQRADRSFVLKSGPDRVQLSDSNAAWVERRPGTGAFDKLAVKTRGRLKPGGSTTLNNGDVLVLFKDYKLTSGLNNIAIERFKPGSITAGKVAEGEVLLDVSSHRRPQKILDNMEGIASFLHDGAEYVLLASDNNFNWKHQKNRLLLFRLH